jgi:hypothetical protein
MYAEDVRENRKLCGSFACDAKTLEDLLLVRGALERLSYQPTAAVRETDEMVLTEGISANYGYVAKYGSEWPFHLPEIQAGRYPLERLPEHLRELAEELYYPKISV